MTVETSEDISRFPCWRRYVTLCGLEDWEVCASLSSLCLVAKSQVLTPNHCSSACLPVCCHVPCYNVNHLSHETVSSNKLNLLYIAWIMMSYYINRTGTNMVLPPHTCLFILSFLPPTFYKPSCSTILHPLSITLLYHFSLESSLPPLLLN